MELPIIILGIIFGFILVNGWLQNRAKERKEKLRVIEEAIRSGNLDPGMQAELVGQLTGRSPHRRPSRFQPSRVVFGLGWLAMFIGIGVTLIDERDAFEAGCVVAAIGFGLVSLPIAMRELDARRAPNA